MNTVNVAKLLLERGAELDVLDSDNHATPLGWALHTGMVEGIELFARYSRHIFTIVAGAQIDRVRELLTAEPELARAIAETHIGLGLQGADPGDTPLHTLPDDDEDAAYEIAELLLDYGADPTTRNKKGQTPVDRARSRGHHDLAELLDRATGNA
jgi:ankyrin repeat protein